MSEYKTLSKDIFSKYLRKLLKIFFTEGSAWFYAEGEDKKKAIQDKNRDEHFPYYLERLDAIAGKNNGFLALGRVNFAADNWFIF